MILQSLIKFLSEAQETRRLCVKEKEQLLTLPVEPYHHMYLEEGLTGKK
jgi:hypothetical protein